MNQLSYINQVLFVLDLNIIIMTFEIFSIFIIVGLMLPIWPESNPTPFFNDLTPSVMFLVNTFKNNVGNTHDFFLK